MNKIVLYNDNVNTFENVIESLMEVCNHNLYQAEQCAMLVHERGKCDIKTGFEEDLQPMKIELKKRGLKVKIL